MFLLLKANSESEYHIAFMHESHPTSPPAIPAITSNSGVFLTLEVDDAKVEYEKFNSADLPIYYHLKEEVWGQKRFGLMTPMVCILILLNKLLLKKDTGNSICLFPVNHRFKHLNIAFNSFLNSWMYKNSSAICERPEKPGPHFKEGIESNAWSEVVGEP